MSSRAKFSRFYQKNHNHEVIGTINVTPFVDVMLVLLIIFMISAPLLVNGVNINLPSNKAASAIDSPTPFTITLDSAGKIYHEDKQVRFSNLEKFIKENVLNRSARIYVRGDRDLSYGLVMKVISEINGAGYKKVSLVTENKTADN